MAARTEDWHKQAGRDLEHAHRAAESGDFEWACFAAQQAAEKALKAVFEKAGAQAWGHSVLGLLRHLPPALGVDASLEDAGRELDRHYIPARYPNAYPQGAPYEFYTEADAGRAIVHAENILRFCERHLA